MFSVPEIEKGLEERQFSLYYQPKFSLTSGEIAGSEALVRWLHPCGKVIPPDEFIPLAEQSSLITKISAYIVDVLMTDLASLRDAGFTPVSFNVSPRDFYDDRLVRVILDALADNEVSPDQIEIEITENEALSCQEAVLSNIRTLCDAGLGLTMDDYGLGYSSIDTLSRWPFSAIKIDRGLIHRMLRSEKNASIVRSAIRLGHELEVEVVAEGVETHEECHFLLEEGCTKVQGYLVSKPLALKDLMAGIFSFKCPASVSVGLVHMAMMDHLVWRKKIATYALRNASLPPSAWARQDPDYPTLSIGSCLLGRWYLADGQQFSHRPEFRDLDTAHRALHAVAARIVASIQRGGGEQEIDCLLHELNQCSLQLLKALTSLEDHGLASIYRDNTNQAYKR